MAKILLIFSLVFTVQNCNSQTVLPAEMPADVNIVLIQIADESSKISISITPENLQIESGSGWHNRSKKLYQVSREDVEKLYRVFLENKFDQIENDDTNVESQHTRNDITVFWNGESVSVYQRALKYSDQNTQRIRFVEKAILEFAETHKTVEIN